MKTSASRLLIALIALLVVVGIGICLVRADCDDGMPRDLCAGTVAVTVFVGMLVSLVPLGMIATTGVAVVGAAPVFTIEPPPKSLALA